MNILITGAAGFLGKHVAQHMLEQGHDVTGFDRVARAADYPMHIGDLLDLEAVRSAAEGKDVICHIGAIGDVYLAGEQPALAASVNVTGSANVGLAAKATGARVVYASTWEVYGEPRSQPITEDHACNPDHPYSITKLAGERMLLAADELSGVEVTALRLGTAYGTGLRPNSVFRVFIDKALAREPIMIQGDGSQTRQFTHARDIARAFELACGLPAHGIAMNVVANEETSIRQLAELVAARLPTEVQFGEPRPGDVPPAKVSAALAESTLGWKAEVSFREGLEELLESLSWPNG